MKEMFEIESNCYLNASLNDNKKEISKIKIIFDKVNTKPLTTKSVSKLTFASVFFA